MDEWGGKYQRGADPRGAASLGTCQKPDCGCRAMNVKSPTETATRMQAEHASKVESFTRDKSVPDMDTAKIRHFSTGATRDTSEGKLVYEAFFSPEVLKRRAEYMHKHRRQPDRSMRTGDNWQKGMPRADYMDSLIRHVADLWLDWRRFHVSAQTEFEDLLCAIMFNAEGLLFELLRGRDLPKEPPPCTEIPSFIQHPTELKWSRESKEPNV